ncbi:ABC transporter ATP-binding protein [Paraburkholderia phosphatilytica]|uniref:ABC transporter ATP-binding protein n=1 Tax=Paraburkholderia phosphatilytica TaxID=2282883 RepID=UPI000E48745F|nr:ABC transporter ATP-binding protein [Paraburkholderia phosphatilytica]
MTPPPLLELHDLCAWYGASQALHGVNLAIHAGEIVALAGRNGSGRSTLAKAVMRLVRTEGTLRFAGQPIDGMRTFEVARRGIGYVAEHRDVFPALTVRQNLQLGATTAREHTPPRASFTFDDAFALFPALRERRNTRADVLSGGEQQMLALARALLGQPDLLIVDEPAEGLAGQVIAQLAQSLRTLRERGVAVLLIEQRFALAQDLADRVAVMGHGSIVFDGSFAALRQRGDIVTEWLGVG